MSNILHKITWYRFGQKKGSYLSRDISFWHMFKAKYLENIPYFGFRIRHYKYIDWTHYMDRQEMEKTFQVLLKRLLRAKNLKNFYHFALDKEREVKRYCSYLLKIITPDTSNKELAKLFKQWVALKGWPDVNVPCGNFLVRTLSQEIEKQAKKYFPNLSEQQLKEQLVTLAYNSRETAFFSREREILELAIKWQRYQKTPFKKLPTAVQKQINQFNKKYDWLSVMFLIYHSIPDQDLWKEIQDQQRSGAIQKLKELQAIKERSLQARKKLLKAIKPNKQFLKVLNLLRESSWVEASVIKFFQMSSYCSISFLKLIAKRLGLTYDDLINFGYQEITRSLITGRPLDKQLLAKRKVAYGFYIDLDKKVFKSLDAKLIKLYQEDQSSKDLTLLKGMTASPGRTKGKVRIIIDVTQLPSFRPKEILVTTMTTPNFIMVMKKAAAIVTNDGGITCHAAIVSRELGIPCVIGTKIATKVLKDGDLVEVDATKGIVKKI